MAHDIGNSESNIGTGNNR